MKKIVFFGFTDELMCFAHTLFNADQMIQKGWQAKVVIEGRSTVLIPILGTDKNPFKDIYLKLKEQSLISVCRACANKTGNLAAAEAEGLKIDAALLGHPSIYEYMEEGWEIVTI